VAQSIVQAVVADNPRRRKDVTSDRLVDKPDVLRGTSSERVTIIESVAYRTEN
jgi:hypothetical protein